MSAIEIIIVIAMLGVIFVLAWSGTRPIQQSLTGASAQDVEQMIATAVRHARAGAEGLPWGIYLPYNEQTRKTDTIVVFAGLSYALREQEHDVIVQFTQDVRFTNVSLSGDSISSGNDHEATFAALSGHTAQYGSITLESFGITKTIVISPYGMPTN